MSLSDEIDRLLERYLVVLDQYTSLREELGRTHAATLQHIARANFSADRGLRYGQDFYDERMQAARRCRVEANSEGFPTMEISKALKERRYEEKQSGANGSRELDNQNSPSKSKIDGEKEKPQPAPLSAPDPMRMFGILTPPSLRYAQQSSIFTVEEIIPKLVSLDAELKELEIKIRRARKYRAKAEGNGGNADANGGQVSTGR